MPGVSTPLVVGDYLIAGLSDGGIVCYNAKTGEEIWYRGHRRRLLRVADPGRGPGLPVGSRSESCTSSSPGPRSSKDRQHSGTGRGGHLHRRRSWRQSLPARNGKSLPNRTLSEEDPDRNQNLPRNLRQEGRPEVDLSLVDAMVARIGKKSVHLIPLLQAIQKTVELPARARAGAHLRDHRDHARRYHRRFDVLLAVPPSPGRQTHHQDLRRHRLPRQRRFAVLDETFRSHLKIAGGRAHQR